MLSSFNSSREGYFSVVYDSGKKFYVSLNGTRPKILFVLIMGFFPDSSIGQANGMGELRVM
jgi:hypothetical protein